MGHLAQFVWRTFAEPEAPAFPAVDEFIRPEPAPEPLRRVPLSFLTGSSKLATVRRLIPKTVKNASQNDFASASSRESLAHSLLNAMALWRISFHEMGIGVVLVAYIEWLQRSPFYLAGVSVRR